MLRVRIIPVLLLRNKGLVKTVKFKDPKYIGDPINAVKIFNDKEVDELVFFDIDASKQGREPDFQMIKHIATECFMPFGYGGGVSKLDHVKKLFTIGVEKVILNTQSLKNLSLVSQSAEIFGDQSIVVCIDVKRNFWGNHQVYSHSGKLVNLPADVVEYAAVCQNVGAGEIIINSVDQDGTMKGYDLDLIHKLSNVLSIPLVVCGGAGSLDDFKNAHQAGASGLAAGSLFVYYGPHRAVLINYPATQALKGLFG